MAETKSKAKAKEVKPEAAEVAAAPAESVQEPLNYDAMEEYVEIELFYDGEKCLGGGIIKTVCKNGEKCWWIL